ncbi:MAG: sigma-54-dependent Fis family transcriptional regulator [Candidatus Zixiibacteriota bacterium]|nr:MAG: sigma-54-dependent Fis family transcriptional regulator [candidate division Zixibacteria bacterium]
MANILVVDDEPKMTSLICGHLEDSGHSVQTTTKPAEAIQLVRKHSFDVVITDLSMPEISGMEVLEEALKKEGTGVIMMTAYGSVESAVEAMKKGAADYLLKPFSLEELGMAVDRLVESQKLSSLSKHYREVIDQTVFAEFIGDSQVSQKVKELIAKVAGSDATVLLTGKSGTGKEVAARMLHNMSPRKDKPFIAVNCAALTETLLESELFGHEKGAFTGAVARKHGRFELADGGTIFLDEIAETSPALQSKLLRVLEERKLVRVGGVDMIDIDVRVVAATNRNLKEEMESGRFREDLYFRLNVFPINIPNLSERSEDIVPLAEYFVGKLNYPHRKISAEVADLLLQYDWPGNIRELKNVIERAMILAGGEPLSAEDFSLEADDSPIIEGRTSGTEHGLESAEKRMILDALEKTGGNKTEAAKMLKITRRRLYSRMKVHDIKA